MDKQDSADTKNPFRIMVIQGPCKNEKDFLNIKLF